MFVKITLTEATPLDVLAHRFTIAAAFATIILLFRKEVIKVSKKDILMISLLALFYPTLFFWISSVWASTHDFI